LAQERKLVLKDLYHDQDLPLPQKEHASLIAGSTSCRTRAFLCRHKVHLSKLWLETAGVHPFRSQLSFDL